MRTLIDIRGALLMLRRAKARDEAVSAVEAGIAIEAEHDADAPWLRERGFLPCP